MEKKILALAAMGLVGGVGGVATAQPFVINVSGATLLENFSRVPASTNDWLDVDGDGIAGSLGSAGIDQLAPATIDPFVLIAVTMWRTAMRSNVDHTYTGPTSPSWFRSSRTNSGLESPVPACTNPGSSRRCVSDASDCPSM